MQDVCGWKAPVSASLGPILDTFALTQSAQVITPTSEPASPVESSDQLPGSIASAPTHTKYQCSKANSTGIWIKLFSKEKGIHLYAEFGIRTRSTAHAYACQAHSSRCVDGHRSSTLRNWAQSESTLRILPAEDETVDKITGDEIYQRSAGLVRGSHPG